jgi:Tfp pilus assembly protein PilF
MFFNDPFYYYSETPNESEGFCAYRHQVVAKADELYIVTTFPYDILHR